jgi:hypothetical protein
MTIDERLDRLTTIVESLAATVVSHDDQIEALISLAEKQTQKNEDLDRRIESLVTSTANLEKQWQAYLRSLPRN